MSEPIRVELPDGRFVEFPEGTSRDTMQGAIQRLLATDGGNTAPAQGQGRSIGQTIYENVIGSGEGDTPGERLGQTINEMGRAFFPGVARGAAELAGLPGTISDVMDVPFERMGLLPDVEGLPSGSPLSGQVLRGLLSNATGGGTEYRSETIPGRVAGTVGEFAPGGLFGGARGFLANAVLPGAASEGAGILTEGTAMEPWARAAAAIGTSLVANPAIVGRSPNVRTPGANAEQRALAEYLQRQGIQPTAGQTSGSNILRRMEGTTAALPSQIEDVTAAAMRSLGSQASRATPATLREASQRIGQAMDDALAGVSFRPPVALAQSADDIVEQYMQMAPSATVVPRVRNIADEIIDAATNPSAPSIDLTTLRVWRTALGRMTQSSDEATRTAAIQLRGLIDDATDAALTAAGREADLQSLGQAREQWRNYLAISDASTRAGSEAGVLSPAQLNQAIIRTQGRGNYAIGQGTNLMETSRAAGEVLRSMPTVEAGGVRYLGGAGQMGAAGAGAYLGQQLAGMPGMVAGGLLGAAAPPVGRAAMRSNTVQAMLMDPAFAALTAGRTAPGLLAN